MCWHCQNRKTLVLDLDHTLIRSTLFSPDKKVKVGPYPCSAAVRGRVFPLQDGARPV